MPLPRGLGEMLLDLRCRVVPAGGRGGDLLVELTQLCSEPVELALRVLELLHHLELGVLELVDPPLQGDQLALHALEVLGVRDEPLVHPVLVALATGLDLLDVGVGALLRRA